MNLPRGWGEARFGASSWRWSVRPVPEYRSTDQRRPSAFFAARASFTPSPSVVLFFDEPSMYADSMLTLFLPRRFAARASVRGLFRSLTSTILRSPEMRYFLALIARRALAAPLSSTTT